MDTIDQDVLLSFRPQGQPSSIFSYATEAQLAIDNPKFYAALTKGSVCAYIFQVACLVATVACYVGPPIIINWAKTVGHDKSGKPVKVSTFLEVSVVIFSKITVILLALIYAFLSDYQAGGTRENLHMFLDWRRLLPWLPIGAGYAVGDVAEVMANGNVDAVTYTVLSQTRLVGTAIAMRLMIGSKRSILQWSILLNLSIVLMGWELIPNVFGVQPEKSSDSRLLGTLLTCLKLSVSIVGGVLAQKQLQKSGTPMIIQQGHCCTCGFLCSLMLAPLLVNFLYPAMDKPWVDSQGVPLGFFGGMPVPVFRPPLPNAGQPTGWNYKTWCVLGMYVFREIFCTYCVKRFDALVKNICNSVALIITYLLTVFMFNEIPFNAAKALFAAVVCLEILHYGVAESPK